MDIGLDVEPPKKTCSDRNCPFHGHLKVRGQIFIGRVVGGRMSNTVVIERAYHRYLRKYERYEKRRAKYLAHNPQCIDAAVGEEVKLIECRPISKAKTLVVVEKRGLTNAKEEKTKAPADKISKPQKKKASKKKVAAPKKKESPSQGKSKRIKKRKAK